MAPLGRAPLFRGRAGAAGHRSCGERGLRPEGAERALAAHRGHCQHVSPASRDRGQCVRVGERWQHSLGTRVCGGGSWQRAGRGHAGLGTVRSLPGTDGTAPGTEQGCCRCPAPSDTADPAHPVPGSSLPAAAKTGSRM